MDQSLDIRANIIHPNSYEIIDKYFQKWTHNFKIKLWIKYASLKSNLDFILG